MSAPWTAGNARKVSNYGRWEAVITTPEGNVGKAYGDEKSKVEANVRLMAEAPAMEALLRSLLGQSELCHDDHSAIREILASIEGEA